MWEYNKQQQHTHVCVCMYALNLARKPGSERQKCDDTNKQ